MSSSSSLKLEPQFDNEDNGITHSTLTTPAVTRASSPVQQSLPRSPLPSGKHKVAVIGSGSWGTALAKIAAQNVAKNNKEFHAEVRMWVRQKHVRFLFSLWSSTCTFADPQVEGKKLTDVINRTHQNSRYLPDIRLPKNLVAVPHLRDVVKDATLIVVCVPHQVSFPLSVLYHDMHWYQFLHTVLSDLLRYEAVHPGARAITAIKGVEVNGTDIETFASLITDKLDIPTSALSGANIALEGMSICLGEGCADNQSQRTNSVKPPSELHPLKTLNFGKQYSTPQHLKYQS